MQKRFQQWICSLTSSIKQINALLEQFGSAEGIYRASEGAISKCRDVTDRLKAIIIDNRTEECLFHLEQNMARYGISFVFRDEEHFPQRLLNIDDCPFGLFYQGELPDSKRPAIAVIGARSCTHYGEEMAEYFSESLGKAGIDIISGLAMGIDGISHVGALDSNARTYAVLGSGIGVPYPKENWKVYQRIRQENGGILSEHPYGTPAYQYNFPLRNRLISGLADGVLVIEAHIKSGTLITVDRALEQGKDVYAVPGRIGDIASVGCNQLIKQGARLVTEPNEIIEELSTKYTEIYHNNPDKNKQKQSETIINNPKNQEILLASNEKIVYACLRLDLKHFDVLVSETHLAPAELAGILISLEERGIIRQPAPNYYSIPYGVKIDKY